MDISSINWDIEKYPKDNMVLGDIIAIINNRDNIERDVLDQMLVWSVKKGNEALTHSLVELCGCSPAALECAAIKQALSARNIILAEYLRRNTPPSEFNAQSDILFDWAYKNKLTREFYAMEELRIGRGMGVPL